MKSERKFSVKKLFRRIFGKARWYLLGLGICLLYALVMLIWNPDRDSSEELTGKLWGEELPFDDVTGSTVSRDGDIS